MKEPKNMTREGEIIWRALQKRGENLTWLASQLKITPSAASYYLRDNLTRKTLEKINRVLPIPELVPPSEKPPQGEAAGIRDQVMAAMPDWVRERLDAAPEAQVVEILAQVVAEQLRSGSPGFRQGLLALLELELKSRNP